jgi:hypothetical protein
VSFAAAPAGRIPLRAFPQKAKEESLSLGYRKTSFAAVSTSNALKWLQAYANRKRDEEYEP